MRNYIVIILVLLIMSGIEVYRYIQCRHNNLTTQYCLSEN